MMRLNFGDMDDALLSGDIYFDYNIDFDCIETDFGRKVIKEVAGADVVDRNLSIHPDFGSIPTEKLGGGIKALMILMFDSDVVVDLAAMGDNCLKFLGDIEVTKDFTVCTDSFRHVWNGHPIYILNSGRTVNSDDELWEEWVKYRKGGGVYD